MKAEDIVISSWDAGNVGGQAAELSIRLPKPLRVSAESRISLEKLILNRPGKSYIWVMVDVAQPKVYAGGDYNHLLAVFHCEGSKKRSFTFHSSSICLPLRNTYISNITLRLIDPITYTPIAFAADGSSMAHIRISHTFA